MILGWLLRLIKYSLGLFVGLIIYSLTGKTLPFAYQSMIHLFCLTGGQSNDALSRLIAWFKPKYRLDSLQGVLHVEEHHELQLVLNDLNDQGYHVFEQRLPEELCDRLKQFALTQECTMRPMEGETSNKARRTVYPRGKPETVRYDFSPSDLLLNIDVQKLLADTSFVSVAQEYLGSAPVIDVLGMWWHTAYSDKPDKEAAQYYHFDMDRPKWLKFFIYLTDVTTANGPHTFVVGSHNTGAIPQSMLQQGYARLPDEDVEKHYGPQRIIEFNAPRGTIIAEDTRGLHKGKHVEKGDRLILQIQFSNVLFGGKYPKANLSPDLCDELRITMQKYPALYSAYI